MDTTTNYFILDLIGIIIITLITIYFLAFFSLKSCPNCKAHRVKFNDYEVNHFHNHTHERYTCDKCHCNFKINIYTNKVTITLKKDDQTGK